MKSTGTRAKAGNASPPPRLRCKLRSIDDVRLELARLYRDGKTGRRAVADCSRLANILLILGRMIEGSELEARLEKLERDAINDE